jgi:sarcosine oxidase gamma subunit
VVFPKREAAVVRVRGRRELRALLAAFQAAVAAGHKTTAEAGLARLVAFVFGLGNGKQYEICNH